MKRSTVVRLCTICFLLIVGAALAGVLSRAGDRPPRVDARLLTVDREMPAAVERHLERMKSVPGLESEYAEGPGTAEAQEFLAKAYPDTDIPLARIEAARAAAARLNGKGFAAGKGRPGTWVSVGPSTALYPFTQFRNSFGYVPNTYVASGASTSARMRRSRRVSGSAVPVSTWCDRTTGFRTA